MAAEGDKYRILLTASRVVEFSMSSANEYAGNPERCERASSNETILVMLSARTKSSGIRVLRGSLHCTL